MYRSLEQTKIAVIGLGYVGLPLARLFSTKFRTVGFDLNQARVEGDNKPDLQSSLFNLK